MSSLHKSAARLCFLLSVPLIAIASSGWTSDVFVAELTPTSQGRYLVKLNVSQNPSGCRDKSVFYQDYNLGSKEMFETLLQAVVSGKRVRVYVTGKCDLNGYSEISSVTIQQ